MTGNRSYRWWLYLAAPWPALILGVLVMRGAGLPASIWGQNLVAGLILAAVCLFLPAMTNSSSKPFWWAATASGALGLLAATFLDAGLDGVHRWVQVGPLRIHAAAICLPALILALSAMLGAQAANRWELLILLAGVAASGLLALQPDAAQTTAFAVSLHALLGARRERLPVLGFSVVVAMTATNYAWHRTDPLLPIRHVEGIVGLAAQNGALWLVAALLALALLPLPFLLEGRRGDEPAALALGIYFSLCLLAPVFGAFPVPVMGFGLSPIIGYFVALGWLAARERRAEI